jgi:hypothetical protein
MRLEGRGLAGRAADRERAREEMLRKRTPEEVEVEALYERQGW